MNCQVHMERRGRIIGLIGAMVFGTLTFHSLAFAQGNPVMVGITPLTSKVADIPSEEAQELFINALMETNSFAIRPPDANGSYVGSTYVFEPTLTEAKAKTNVLGFLKDVATSKSPVNLTVRVFDPRTNALLKSVTVKSSEVNNAQVSVGDVQSLMSAFGAGKGDQEGKAAKPDATAQLEERLGALMQQAATRLASQLSVGAAAGGLSSGATRTPAIR